MIPLADQCFCRHISFVYGVTNKSLFCENKFRYLAMDIICYEKRTLIRTRLEENCEVPGTDSVQG